MKRSTFKSAPEALKRLAGFFMSILSKPLLQLQSLFLYWLYGFSIYRHSKFFCPKKVGIVHHNPSETGIIDHTEA